MIKSPRVVSVDATGSVRSVEEPGTREARERLSQLAWLLDSSIKLPGTRLTIGVDALIGLLPVIGDVIGVLISSYVLREAARLGAPKAVLLRMAFNVGVEGVLGSIPFLGDVFDAAWKANLRNVRLLNRWLDQRAKTERSSRLFGTALIFTVIALLTALGIGAFLLVRWIAGLL